MIPDQALSKLEQGQVQLWISKLSDWKPIANDLYDYLSDDEIIRFNRLVFNDKKIQYLISHGVLRLILSSYINRPPDLVDIRTDLSGKPYLPQNQVSFNISHSGDYLLIGFSTGPRIGIDIQKIYSIDNLTNIIKNTFSQPERSYLSRLPADEYLIAFFKIWTAKEAYIKAIGSDYHGRPSDFSTIPDTHFGKFELIKSTLPGSKETWTIQSIPLISGYQAAFALNGAPGQVETLEFFP